MGDAKACGTRGHVTSLSLVSTRGTLSRSVPVLYPQGFRQPATSKKNPAYNGVLIGAPRFELGTSSPPDWRANQAAPRPATGTPYQAIPRRHLPPPRGAQRNLDLVARSM